MRLVDEFKAEAHQAGVIVIKDTENKELVRGD